MDIFNLNLEMKDWAIVFSTLLGPVLAVQAQKFFEQYRFKKQRKSFVFEQLMATRGAKLSREHVNALNMIDIVFYGSIFCGRTFRSKTEQKVLDAWKEYLDHLCVNTHDESQFNIWFAKGDDLFVNVLFEIAKDLNFQFDRVLLKKGSYAPMAHQNIENEQAQLRQSMISVLEGKVSLKMDVDKIKIN